LAKRRKNDASQDIMQILISFSMVFALLAGSWKLAIILLLLLVIIYKVYEEKKAQKEAERLRRSGIEQIDKMTGYQFEKYLSELFREHGYKAKVTPERGDYGADLILKRKDGSLIAVQAKRYKKNIGINAIQEASGGRDHYKTGEAWVVTNSFFTLAAKKQSKSSDVRLINREELIKLILFINPSNNR